MMASQHHIRSFTGNDASAALRLNVVDSLHSKAAYPQADLMLNSPSIIGASAVECELPSAWSPSSPSSSVLAYTPSIGSSPSAYGTCSSSI